MNIKTKIKEFLGLTDYCPKHKTKYYIHGYEDLRECSKCIKEKFIEIKSKKLI